MTSDREGYDDLYDDKNVKIHQEDIAILNA